MEKDYDRIADGEFMEYNVGDRIRDQLSGIRGTIIKKDIGTDCDGTKEYFYICKSDDGKHFTRIARYLASIEFKDSRSQLKKNPPYNDWVLISQPDSTTKRYQKDFGNVTYYATIFLNHKGDYELIIVDEAGQERWREEVVNFNEAFHYMKSFSEWKM